MKRRGGNAMAWWIWVLIGVTALYGWALLVAAHGEPKAPREGGKR